MMLLVSGAISGDQYGQSLSICSPGPFETTSAKMTSAEDFDAVLQHYDGTLEYDAHNLYGTYETLATANALQKLRNRRQFILTRYAEV